MTRQEDWARALAQWSIPSEILNQAQTSPWIHPPVLFQIPEEINSTLSHSRALEALPVDGSVLDVGCGGGIAAFALTPPATKVIGVDHQPEMLEMFSANAKKYGVASEVFEGFWPQVAGDVPLADVVVSHHVVYNVADIGPFLLALNSHARNRVVIEMPTRHPLTSMSSAWKHFWNLDRPSEPSSEDLLEVLREIGISATMQCWSGPMRERTDIDQDADFLRIRLCLSPERFPEVREFLLANPASSQRELATIWWDVSGESENN
jgi:SAM-dependent methyltransferase